MLVSTSSSGPNPEVGGGQLDQRQRVAQRDREQPIGGAGGQRAAGVPGDHFGRRLAVEAFERERGEVVAVGARRDHDRHRVGEQAARREQDRAQRGLVQPLRVVDRDQHGTLLGERGEQGERRRADQEPLAADARGQPERRAQRRRLWLRQGVDPVERRAQQRVQARERDLRLGLDPARPQHEHPLRTLDGVLQQRRLAHPGPAGEHERLAGPQPRGGQELLDAGELRVSPDQHGGIVCGLDAPVGIQPRRETASAAPSGDQTGSLRLGIGSTSRRSRPSGPAATSPSP